jgi:copper transport protein
MRRIVLCWIILLLLIFAGSPLAFAHANLQATTPRDGQIVQKSPGEITLEFSEQLEEGLIDLKLYDGNGRQIALAGPNLAAGDAAQMRAKLPELPDGTYTVVWSVVSEDGHPVNGSFSFSVGRTVSGTTAPVSDGASTFIDRALAAIRYVVEGTLLLRAGLHWLSWLGRRRGWPEGVPVIGRGRRAVWFVLVAGLIAEGLLYLAALPGNGLASVFLGGQWTILGQSPFLGMVGAQLALMLLIAVPGMVESWYLVLWALSVGALAFGGHAWGIQPVWLAAVFRILHLYSLSLWLGALTYLLLAMRWERKSGAAIEWRTFRRFFVRLALLASATTLLSGAAMTVQQTDWAALWTNGQAWSVLLGLKVTLTAVMLLLAITQTLRWRQHGRLMSPTLLRWEWGVGALAVLAGVWMSQSAYPLPVTSYSKSFHTRDAQVVVQIPRVAPGTQIMTIDFPASMTEPRQVLVQVSKPDALVNRQPIPAERTGPGHYRADIPFSMYGTWTYRIDAAFHNGTHAEFTDMLFIPGGGETR